MTDDDTTMAAKDRTTSDFRCDEVVPGLFQGDFPDEDVDWSRFDDVVSMTEDLPPVRLRRGGLWLHVPTWDGEVEDATGIRDAARTVADRVTAGRRVLVHCWMGLNRSGVVSARALMFMGITVGDAIAAVRAARGENALFNGYFVQWLYTEAGETVPDSEHAVGWELPDDLASSNVGDFRPSGAGRT
jgi:hypothetical protein